MFPFIGTRQAIIMQIEGIQIYVMIRIQYGINIKTNT